jgi:hypothetical protein
MSTEVEAPDISYSPLEIKTEVVHEVAKPPPVFKCHFHNLFCRDLDEVWWWTTNPFIYFNFDNFRTGSTGSRFQDNDPSWEKVKKLKIKKSCKILFLFKKK